ncbi:hypothetical protein [Sphingomonas bacterium]|uniref:hypothetical protein n=1 Tax=Sphingomonas bacterium TaxID=1895847 RepID=UPI0020C69519|nr:hypothetical protein [Sphingomonas bacterium]
MKPAKHARDDADAPVARMTDDQHRAYWGTHLARARAEADPDASFVAEPYQTVELRRRRDGWTAERQRLFLGTLANTGSIAHAGQAADITPRSAFRLRNHPKGEAFGRAMDAAQMTAAKRLLGIAFERAITGTPRQVWRQGRIVAESSVPSDRLLMFLLRHLAPDLFGADADPAQRHQRIEALQGSFADALAALTDTDVVADLLDADDYRPQPPMTEQA